MDLYPMQMVLREPSLQMDHGGITVTNPGTQRCRPKMKPAVRVLIPSNWGEVSPPSGGGNAPPGDVAITRNSLTGCVGFRRTSSVS